MSECFRGDLHLRPFERRGGLVVNFNECVNFLAQFSNAAEIGSAQSLAAENTEPNLDLVEPRGMGWGVVKVYLWMLRQPPVIFRLVCI